MSYPEILGKMLQRLRKTSGYSQQTVSDALGIDRSTYSCYERGVTVPTAEICYKLARVYNIRPSDLMDINSALFSDSRKSLEQDYAPQKKTPLPEDLRMRLTELSKEERAIICLYRSLPERRREELEKSLRDLASEP